MGEIEVDRRGVERPRQIAEPVESLDLRCQGEPTTVLRVVQRFFAHVITSGHQSAPPFVPRYSPAPSGPRWASASVIARTALRSMPRPRRSDTWPTIPHMAYRLSRPAPLEYPVTPAAPGRGPRHRAR